MMNIDESPTINKTARPTGRDYIARFLESKAHSPSYVRNLRSILNRFFKFTGKLPLDVQIGDWDAFVADLNAGRMNYTSKKTARANLFAFFEFVKYRAERELNLQFNNPIPKLEYAGISRDSTSKRQAKLAKAEKRIPSAKFREILNVARKMETQLYVILLILTHCGMRVNELLTVRRCNVHLEERWLETGIEDDARKSNKLGDRRIFFCFPTCVKYALWQYLKVAPESEWLFPRQDPNRYYSSSALYGRIKVISKRISFHFPPIGSATQLIPSEGTL